jgi:histidinol-phosphatase (PHP family)
MWANFHTHSNFCDGKGVMEDYVRSARDNGLISLGFSSHAPVPFPCHWCLKADDFNQYLQSINALAQTGNDLEIYKSLEVDYIPGVISPAHFSTHLDYTIGSVHFVEKLPDGKHWEIDGLHTHFLEGYEKIFNSNIRDVISRYFELTREMITTSAPTIVGHLDKIKIQNIDEKFFREADPWYQEEVIKTLDVIRESGAIVEVNTRGIYQKKSRTTYPSPWILEHIHEKNIPITLSSDTHHPDDIINQFSETAKLLSTLGFKTLKILHAGTWEGFYFNERGLYSKKHEA